MRETLARVAVCAVVVGLVLLAVLAARREAKATRPLAVSDGPLSARPTGLYPAGAMAGSPEQLARGAALFASLGCRSCHSLAGEGNPGLPLDDVGLRRDRDGILPWITGEGAASAELSPAARRRKSSYQTVPPEDLMAMAAFLALQRTPPP
jgi:cytochrome c5